MQSSTHSFGITLAAAALTAALACGTAACSSPTSNQQTNQQTAQQQTAEADPSASKDLMKAAYDEVIAKYEVALTQNGEEFLTAYGQDNAGAIHGHVDGVNNDMIAEHFRFGDIPYYGYVDFNKDGVNELVIALGSEHHHQVWDVFSFDGSKAVPLFVGKPLEYRVNLYILEDGTFMVHSANGANAGTDTFYRIAAGGHSLTYLFEYAYDYQSYGTSDHFGENDSMTDEDFTKTYWDHATDAAKFGDITFTPILPSDAAAQAEADGETSTNGAAGGQ